MATTNGAIGAVNPKTDKTLKLENVSMEAARGLHYTENTLADGEEGHINRDRETLSKEMARIWCFQRLGPFDDTDTSRIDAGSRDTETISQILWDICIPVHERHPTCWP